MEEINNYSKLGFYHTDCETILSHMKQQDYQLQLKRRWLLGLSMSKSENKRLLRYKSLPESFLREDDMFYDTVKNHVDEAFGVNNDERVDSIVEEIKHMFESSNLKGILLSCIDALTNKGLFLLAALLTGGSINFKKTRPKMKKVIRKLIPWVTGPQNHHSQVEIFVQLSQLLKDPRNVQDNFLMHVLPTSHSVHASAIKILKNLGELPSQTLLAMRRKLRGEPADTLHLQQKRYGFRRDQLIFKVKRRSEQMLSDLVRGDELQEPLAKALAIAGLSLKLKPEHSPSSVSDFDQFSPDVKSLQNEIAKAIWLVGCKTKVRVQELKTLQLILDPKACVPIGSLRTSIRKMLTEYLFECSDLDKIPKSLSDALAIINRSSRSMPSRWFLKEAVEKDVDSILSLSAQMKQVVWAFLRDHDLDEAFTDVYMEELEDSDDNDDGQELQQRNVLCNSVDLDEPEESCGEFVPVDSKPSTSCFEQSHGPGLFQEKRNVARMPNVNATQFKENKMGRFGTSRINGNGFASSFPSSETSERHPEQTAAVDLGNPSQKKFMSNGHSEITNLYLGVQEVCDATSIVAYDIIGCMMEKFAQEEGLDLEQRDSKYLGGYSSNMESAEERQPRSERNADGSIIVQVVDKLVPSMPKSRMEKLKELLGVL